VIFVTGFDSPLTGTEVSFLTAAARHAGKLFLVLNKRDLISARDAAAITEFVRRQLREELSLGEPRLFGLSALEALEATVRGDGEALFSSGLAPLHTALTGFLATGKTRVLCRSVMDPAGIAPAFGGAIARQQADGSYSPGCGGQEARPWQLRPGAPEQSAAHSSGSAQSSLSLRRDDRRWLVTPAR
jgi:hypothetical protein